MTDRRISLTLVLHNHQPVGNFDHVFHLACDKAYLPFLSMLQEFPRLRLGLHTSGCLWEWLERHRPEYGKLVDELLADGQLELLGGGMYEPILPVLPERDAVWQLKRLSSFLEQRFGRAPSGMWCPERVWEPHMPQLLAKAGLRYTLLDDYHFRASALPEQISTDYFITEHAGSLVSLFPISQKLRYTLPFKPVQDTLDYLRQLAETSEHTPLVVFGDDGEKFGIWPETHAWVYGKGWLRSFFTELSANLDWIDLLLPSEVLERRRPAAKVFIPCASYAEMGEWTRVDPQAAEDAPTGFWRNYLYKYPESNAMYRRMLSVSEQLERARGLGYDEAHLAAVADDLGRAQCNCAYWHGVFGGLYLNYLRQSVNFHALKAETELRRICPELKRSVVTRKDHDGLGWEQYIMDGEELSALLDPERGLCLTRLDYRPTCFCWTDVLARRREAYHSKVEQASMLSAAAGEHESIHDRVVVKEPGLEGMLVVDPHPRVGFTTYFSDLQDPAELLSTPNGHGSPTQQFADYGIGLTHQLVNTIKVSGLIEHAGFSLEKSATVTSEGLEFSVRLAHGSLPPSELEFFVEFNFTLLTAGADNRYLLVAQDRRTPAEAALWRGVNEIKLVDGWQGRQLVLRGEHMQRLLYYPVYTVSSSEGGFERTYQGSCVLLCYHPLALLEGIAIRLAIEEMTAA